MADFSNKYGELHRWTFESTNSTVETIWSNYYAAIGRVNFFIDGVGKIDENPEIELTETQRQQINVYERILQEHTATFIWLLYFAAITM